MLLIVLGFDLLMMITWGSQALRVAGLTSARNNNNQVKFMHTHIPGVTNRIVLSNL